MTDVSAILGIGVFGFLTGALYRWRIGQDGAPRLWVVGLGFVVMLSAAGLTPSGSLPVRLALWTWLCVLLVVGRRFRLQLEAWRLGRKHRRLEGDA